MVHRLSRRLSVGGAARRALLKDARLYLALAIGLLLLAPNPLWNASHGFATLSHTADNAKWTGPLVNPLRALEFLGAQFGVFGPILFAGLIAIAVRAWRHGVPEPDRLLLAFALPVLVVITLQALLSRAHANWAAVSYVAGTVLVTATLVRDLSWRWLSASFAINGTAAVLIVAGRASPAAPRSCSGRTPSRARSAGANSPRPCAANSSRRGNRAARSAPERRALRDGRAPLLHAR